MACRSGNDAVEERAAYAAERRSQFYPKADVSLSDDVLKGLATLPRQIALAEARVTLKASGFDPVGLTAMNDVGTFHEVFSFTSGGVDLVMKANRTPELIVDRPLRTEVSVSRELFNAGIPHGRVRLADCGRKTAPFDFQVMDRVVGVSLRSMDRDDDATEKCLPLLAATLRSSHAIAGSRFGLITSLDRADEPLEGAHASWFSYLSACLESHLSTVVNAGQVSAREAALIEEVFGAAEQIEAPARLLHGDCGPHNAIVDGSRLSLIDWEDALIGDPLFDVAMWATFAPERRWATFFRTYFDADWEPDFTFWVYFLRISLAKAVVRLRFGYRDVPGRTPASQRIPRALAVLASADNPH